VANLLIQNARTEDTVARIAGAEFALHANGIGMTEAVVICERVRSAVTRQPFADGGQTVPVTLSLGLASLKQDGADSVEALLRLASQRVVQARIEGGNRLCGSIPNQSPPVVEEVTLAAPETEPGLDLQALESPAGDHTAVGLEIPGALLDPSPLIEAPDAIGAEAGNSGELAIPAATPSPPEAELISIDRALTLLARGREQLLLPYLEGLMRQLQPLLDLYHRHRK
jgi:hypothetical protein